MGRNGGPGLWDVGEGFVQFIVPTQKKAAVLQVRLMARLSRWVEAGRDEQGRRLA